MPAFEYKGISANGKSIKGVIEAESDRQARSRLKAGGTFPTELKEIVKSSEGGATQGFQALFGGSNVSASLGELSIATRQLSTLFGAGIPLVEAIRALGDQLDNKKLKGVFAEVGDEINEGETLAKSMGKFPKVFPTLYCNMIASGEVSGTLEVVLERLADLLESQAELRTKMITASVYPGVMLGMCLTVIVVLLTFVVPQIAEIFQDQDKELPLPTQMVINLSDFLLNYWILLLGLLGVMWVAFLAYKKTPKGKSNLDRIKLRFPLIGNIVLKISTARLSRTMGTMLQSGVELLTTLSIVQSIVGNSILEDAVKKSALGVKEGRSLAEELKKSGEFPTLLTHLIRIGEKTGRLEEMLLRAARTYESEVDAVVSSFTKILEPILILFFAIVVGGIVMAVMLPLLEMSSIGA